uniref:Uncharacterized protein n=1 Tax=Schizaphis graminum TaxID=13262 RepID=A0A2S2NAR8_SCHGA
MRSRVLRYTYIIVILYVSYRQCTYWITSRRCRCLCSGYDDNEKNAENTDDDDDEEEANRRKRIRRKENVKDEDVKDEKNTHARAGPPTRPLSTLCYIRFFKTNIYTSIKTYI